MKISERVNRTYELSRVTLEPLLDNGSVQCSAAVRLELAPRPQVILDCEFSSTETWATNEIRGKQEVVVRLDNGKEIECFVGSGFRLGGGKIGIDLILKSEPVTVLEDSVTLARCKFALINFPSMWGDIDVKRYSDPANTSRSFIYQRFQLEAGPWFIDIIGVDSLMGLHIALTRRGGSAITHVGNIKRVDQREFSIDELGQLLTTLHLFLSFARGSYCGLTLLSGHNRDRDRVWEQWGTHKAEPWRRDLPTWVPRLKSHLLSQVFSGFWRALTDDAKRDIMLKVVHWYLRSNDSIEPEVSVVLTHAALERIAYQSIGQRPKQKKEGDWIAEALDRMGIIFQVPAECQELRRLQGRYNLAHGPHALVALRNELVHPENRYGPISLSTFLEAQSLGLHYVEQTLLYLSGYTGEQVSRY